MQGLIGGLVLNKITYEVPVLISLNTVFAAGECSPGSTVIPSCASGEGNTSLSCDSGSGNTSTNPNSICHPGGGNKGWLCWTGTANKEFCYSGIST